MPPYSKASERYNSKSNKVKVGDTVQLSQRYLDWHVSHLSWLYGAPASDSTEREIREEDLLDIFGWLDAKVNGKLPKGVACHYGESDDKDGKPMRRKVVYIQFTFKTGQRDIKDGLYVSEKDLKVVKKAKKKSK